MTGDVCLIPSTESFTLGELLGTGSFASVYKAMDKTTEAFLAIKYFKLRMKDRIYISRATSEIAFIKVLSHPNIISYVCCDVKKYYIYLGIEYSRYGSLSNFLQRRCVLSELNVQAVMRQLLNALCYLHSMRIFHGDIKPENVIIMEEKPIKIKLIDFGLSEVILKNQTIQKKAGSFFYMSPEIQLGFPADHTSDLFSAGIVMYEMLCNGKPFPTRITKEEYVLLLRKRTPIKYPEDLTAPLSGACMDLLKNLLSYDKDKRLTGTNLMRHPFIRSEMVKDYNNHYIQAYESFVASVDLVKEKNYGSSFVAATEALIHLQIHSTMVDDPGLYGYVSLKLQEFAKFGDRVLNRIISDGAPESLDAQTDTERLRCLLQSSPEMLSAFDLCVVGEMYCLQGDMQRGRNLLKNGLQILINKMPHEPEGMRRKLLGVKMTRWMGFLEDRNQGASISGQTTELRP